MGITDHPTARRAFLYYYDGVDWEPATAAIFGGASDTDYNVAVLAFAARTAYTLSDPQVNPSTGAYIMLDVTAVPGGGQTLQMFVDILEPDGSYTAIYQTAALSTVGLRKYLIYPGAVDDGAQLTGVTRLPMPRTWRARMTPSAAGSFTYGVGAFYIP